MHGKRVLQVRATYDREAGVWVAESDDVPGLITEADDISSLLAKLEVLIPELLDENGGYDDKPEIPFSVMWETVQIARRHSA